MKRIRCPKCDNPIIFDDTNYTSGQTLIFECEACRKQFKIRTGLSQKQEVPQQPAYGNLVVIENAFHYKQEIPLCAGENIVGRFVKGTKANAAIKTVDPSIDTTHCIITVKPGKGGNKTQYILQDAPSGTGTYLMNNILGDRDRVQIQDGAIITIGATTMILRTGETED
ncbi:FHA domain-containing protein [Bacteroides acidifaciens]|uniref:FHA domain-containing protein n=1 Tax=Bacteroides acidifaciens TaxID=85831 RepID=UPI0030143357